MARAATTADAHDEKKKPPRDATREVVETIVFVVVLVLLLKLFVTEAFVIPTGSMAETLYGYQTIITCPKCGHQFPVNSHDEVEPNAQDGKLHPLVGYCCPNCRYLGKVADLSPPPTPSSGDRVLVLKPLYHLREPHRGDVVVFKYPEEPQQKHTAQNYIKRAMGFGGETIAIHRGDLFVTRSLTYPNSDPNFQRPENPLDLWRPKFMYQNSDQAEKLFEASRKAGFTDKVEGGFRIIRKTEAHLLADRRIVWDNDKQPKDLLERLGASYRPRWYADGAGKWNGDDPRQPRVFAHSGDNLDWLRYRHLVWTRSFNSLVEWHWPARSFAATDAVTAALVHDEVEKLKRDLYPRPDAALLVRADDNTLSIMLSMVQGVFSAAAPIAGPIDNMLGYNAGIERYSDRDVNPRDRRQEALWVGDLILECEAELGAGAEVVLELSRGANRFQAKFADGRVTLARIGPGAQEFGTPSRPCKVKGGADKTYKLRFANVDARLWVWVNGSLIDFGTEGDYNPVELTNYEPEDIHKEGWTRANDIDAPASIGAKGQVQVRSVTLHRDVYYTRSGEDHTQADIYYVQPGHYMCMGDNSAQSSDSRKWGVVPERLMVGKAVFVFFPLSLDKGKNRVGFIK